MCKPGSFLIRVVWILQLNWTTEVTCRLYTNPDPIQSGIGMCALLNTINEYLRRRLEMAETDAEVLGAFRSREKYMAPFQLNQLSKFQYTLRKANLPNLQFNQIFQNRFFSYRLPELHGLLCGCSNTDRTRRPWRRETPCRRSSWADPRNGECNP